MSDVKMSNDIVVEFYILYRQTYPVTSDIGQNIQDSCIRLSDFMIKYCDENMKYM